MALFLSSLFRKDPGTFKIVELFFWNRNFPFLENKSQNQLHQSIFSLRLKYNPYFSSCAGIRHFQKSLCNSLTKIFKKFFKKVMKGVGLMWSVNPFSACPFKIQLKIFSPFFTQSKFFDKTFQKFFQESDERNRAYMICESIFRVPFQNTIKNVLAIFHAICQVWWWKNVIICP